MARMLLHLGARSFTRGEIATSDWGQLVGQRNRQHMW